MLCIDTREHFFLYCGSSEYELQNKFNCPSLVLLGVEKSCSELIMHLLHIVLKLLFLFLNWHK